MSNKQIRSADGESVATYCPRIGQWRVVEKMGWGLDVRFAAGVNDAVFVENGAGYPGALVGYNAHARRVSRPWGGYGLRTDADSRGAIKAQREVARWR